MIEWRSDVVGRLGSVAEFDQSHPTHAELLTPGAGDLAAELLDRAAATELDRGFSLFWVLAQPEMGNLGTCQGSSKSNTSSIILSCSA
jgi:hypothetical protein